MFWYSFFVQVGARPTILSAAGGHSHTEYTRALADYTKNGAVQEAEPAAS
ncbi:hypothetical protein I4200191B4_12770 [Pseudoflavonifractor gallinarum]